MADVSFFLATALIALLEVGFGLEEVIEISAVGFSGWRLYILMLVSSMRSSMVGLAKT